MSGTVLWRGQEVPLEQFEREQTRRSHPDYRDPERFTNELSGREAQVLWMYGGRGLTIRHVAQRLSITEETAKSYVKRLRQKLRAKALDTDALSIEVGTKRGLYLAALDECRHLPDCQAERDRLLRRLLSSGAPEVVTATGPTGTIRP